MPPRLFLFVYVRMCVTYELFIFERVSFLRSTRVATLHGLGEKNHPVTDFNRFVLASGYPLGE